MFDNMRVGCRHIYKMLNFLDSVCADVYVSLKSQLIFMHSMGEGYTYNKEECMKSKRLFSAMGFACIIFLTFCTLLFAQGDVQKHGSCNYCGMNLEQFSHSRMLIVYDDGTEAGVCSLHCAAVDLALKLDKTPGSIHVGDMNTKKLIDTEKAFWVIGGDRPGVMTKRAKWAFENKADAELFIKGHGGTLITFDDAIKASYEDMYTDTKMIRERRKMKRMQMEKKN